MAGMNENPPALIPELLLLLGAVAGLLIGAWLPRRRQWVVRAIAVLVCLGGLVATGVAMTQPSQTVFDGSFSVDIGLNLTRLIALSAALLSLCLSIDAVDGLRRESEFYVLVLLGTLGAVTLGGANDLMLLVAAYLLASTPLYALAGFAKDAAGTEAALKYYLMGALFGVTMLVGVTLLFGIGGGTDYASLANSLPAAPRAAVAVGIVAVLAGLLFKAGAVPAHFWVPDVTEGSPAPVAAFVTTIPKIGALVALYRLLSQALPQVTVDWPLLVAVVAAVTMTLGNLAAFFQDDARRLLGYSTISQVGYLLMAVAVAGRAELALPGLGFYLAAYAVTNLGAFAVVCELPRARRLADFTGLFSRHRWLALSLVVCLLGLIGTPPTGVYVGKLTVFTAAWDGGLAWLVVVAAVNTVISVFYYLRWIAPLFRRPPPERVAAPADRPETLSLAGRWGKVAAYSAAIASVSIGIASGPVLTALTGNLLLR
jgi:NADH-quinone oxidoreductase subunit N